MKPLRERNQVAVAVVGSILVAAAVLLSMNLGKLPFVGTDRSTYSAEFANAAGLRDGDDVRVEGITVGSVTGIHVVGDHVRIDFTADSKLALGAASDASIEVATVLGQVFLQIESHGPGTLAAGGSIPLSRTTVPFTLVQALGAFGSFANGTDLPRLRASLRTLAGTISGVAPADARAALTGLADVSRTLAGKQDQIRQLLDAASTITDTLNANSGALVQLLAQGDEFLQLLRNRESVVNQLLASTAHLGSELSALMAHNAAQLSPLLANLADIGTVLAQDRDQLANAIARLGQFSVNLSNAAQLSPLLANLAAIGTVLGQDRDQLANAIARLGQFSVNLSNATGAGPWLDLLSPVALTPDNVIAACGAHPDSSNGPCG